VFEASYVGRFAHRLLQEEDLAEPVNLRDPQSKTTYFQAAQALAKQYYAGTPIQNVSAQSIGTNYWENLFPGAGPVLGSVANQLFGTSSEPAGFTQPCLGNPIPNSSTVTATQAMYDLFCNFSGNETTALELADAPGLINTAPIFAFLLVPLSAGNSPRGTISIPRSSPHCSPGGALAIAPTMPASSVCAINRADWNSI